MDGRRFDDFAKAFTQRRSRRSFVRAAGVGLAGFAFAIKGHGSRLTRGSAAAATITPCVLTCSADVSVANDSNQCGVVVNYTPATTIGTCSTGATCTPPSGSFFPVGTTPVTCSADDADGRTQTCSFNVTVNDTQQPTITCPANITQPNDPNQCGAVVSYPPPTATDNCPGVVTACTPASGSFFPVGTTNASCTATDTAGNTATCSFTITIEDTQPPALTCPANITQGTDPGQCSAVVNYPPPGLSDNCPTADVVCGPPAGSAFDLGSTTVTCNAIDFVNNPASCTFTVTVNDGEDPIITCPPNITVDAAPGETSAIVDFADPATSDNCPGVGFACDPASGSAFPVGSGSVTCTATDASGNDVACTFTVTVNAVAAPTATAEASQVPAGGVTTLPSTGTAPSDSSSDLAKWGPLAAIGGAAAILASRLRKSFNPFDEES